MINIESKRIDYYIEKAKELQQFFGGDIDEIKKEYREKVQGKDEDLRGWEYSKETEDTIPELQLLILATIIKQLTELEIIVKKNTKGHTEQITEFINDYLSIIENIIERTPVETCIMTDAMDLESINSSFSAIRLLTQFANIEKNIVLIGGNGSGKSTLAKILKSDDYSNMTVIPAQKGLFFANDNRVLNTRKLDVQEAMLRNSIEMSKAETDYGFYEFQQFQFSKLIIAMKEDLFDYLRDCQAEGVLADKKTAIFDKMNNIMGTTFGDIEICFGADANKMVYCRKEGQDYPINAMSEGEKAALYYSMSVLMASKNSFIVVDEPETFLNPSLANTLWDRLIMERDDCQFIFITHSVNFVLARDDFEIIWIKGYSYPDKYVFETIDDGFDLPKQLMTEILGSKKPLLFCEGDNKSSIDYKVYNALFQDKYTIIPLGGHREVVRYCKVINNAKWYSMEAKGIIDGDLRNEKQRERLKKDGIIAIPFNEVEMLLLSDAVMTATIGSIYPEEADKCIEDFKKHFWMKMKERKQKVVLGMLKEEIDDYLENEKLQKTNTLEDLKYNYKEITDLDIDGKNAQYEKCVEQVLKEKNYSELIKICNLKTEVSNGLANKYLDSDYTRKAINQVRYNKELQTQLKQQYFRELDY